MIAIVVVTTAVMVKATSNCSNGDGHDCGDGAHADGGPEPICLGVPNMFFEPFVNITRFWQSAF